MIMPRDDYLNELKSLRDVPVIKVITGIRRCGKSTLLELFKEYLIGSGVPEDRIITMTLTHGSEEEITAADILNEVRGKRADGEMNYVFLDEIQMARSWEKAVLTIFEEGGSDVYITGSNSEMFSSKLSSLLSGRAAVVEMFPFSYKEFLLFTEQKDSSDSLSEYMRIGGFPLAAALRGKPEYAMTVLDGIYRTAVLRDIIERNNIRNPQMLGRISSFLMRNIGNPVSVKSIADYMVSAGFKVNFETVDSYLGMLEEAFIFYRAKRYDVKAKEELVVNDKFYVADMGLRNSALGFREADIGQFMENLVYLELRRRGYSVFVGKVNAMEIDFVAMNKESTAYYQVSYSIEDPETKRRELEPLKKLRDGHRKTIITMVPSLNKDHDGIREIGLREFLMDNSGQ
ncbi:MAG: ATP-binding protein [Methanomassiliicoccaceae archaeon]|nr:ATP-binding protein [Methanomassiliicoccaceae archaeon]